MPVTITVLLSLGVILFISRFYKNLIYAVIGGILVLVACGFTFAEICDSVWNRIYAANNLFLMLVIVQVI